jgi:hypothetical protein
MKLRQLFENIYEDNGDEEFDGSLKTIGVCFGRFNPPHKGHKAVWQHAAANPIWYVGTNESTSGPKDPLPYDVKLQAMAAVWPKVAGHVIPEQSLLTLASRIYSEHGANVHLKVYTDEEWLIKALQQYNGVEKEHGMYKFVQIDWVKTQRLASATNLRAAVRAGDRASFYKDMGIKPSVNIEVNGKEYPVFDVVAHYLNQYPEPVKKVKKAVAECSGYIPKNKKEAKDPRWSNALTVDIHPGAIEKNLKALKLAEQIASLEQELNEVRQAKITKRQSQSSKGISTYGDSEHVSGDYVSFKLGQAMAGTDGKNDPDIDAKSWHGKKKTIHPYTQEEMDMFKKAAKAVGASYKDLNKGDMRSLELDTTNKVSPVAKRKKNKYGV